MFGYWYNSSLRRYIVLLGDLFSHIQVARLREDNGLKYIKVPITYASKERFMLQLNKFTAIQPSENRTDGKKAKIETVLPRINLHMVDMQYNPMYKTNLTNRTSAQKDATKTVSQYSPTPIKMIFELGIYTRHQDDMFQIIEQVMPYFQPHFNTTITELYTNDIKFERSVNIVLQSVSTDEQVDTDNMSRRRLEWTFMLEVNGWLYPPVADIEGEIKTIYLDFFANSKELNPEGNFESVDTQVVPVSVELEDWDGKYEQTYSQNIPIPVEPNPPKPRE